MTRDRPSPRALVSRVPRASQRRGASHQEPEEPGVATPRQSDGHMDLNSCGTRSFGSTLQESEPCLGEDAPLQVAWNPLLLNAEGTTLEAAQFQERDEPPLRKKVPSCAVTG